jgi:hypothetical protein
MSVSHMQPMYTQQQHIYPPMHQPATHYSHHIQLPPPPQLPQFHQPASLGPLPPLRLLPSARPSPQGDPMSLLDLKTVGPLRSPALEFVEIVGARWVQPVAAVGYHRCAYLCAGVV